ncbi:MAG TPA: 30S ribosomal protein S19 [archaeon]|nr:30S ribosomal protein S19 [archaeon]
MPKVFSYRGYSLDQLKKMSIEEFSRLIPTKERRSLKRGFTEQEKKLLENIRKDPGKFHKTHVRELVILPELVGVKLGIYVSGKKGEEGGKWSPLTIIPEMVGHRLGEFALTCKRVKHSAPGIGATRGSKFIASKT